jgi:hypothetical protein
MTKRSGEKRDFMQTARAVAEQAIGEKMDGSSLPPPPTGKQLAGSKGGKKGGITRKPRDGAILGLGQSWMLIQSFASPTW